MRGRAHQIECPRDPSRYSSAAAAIRGFHDTFVCGAFDKSGGFGYLIQSELAISGRSQMALREQTVYQRLVDGHGDIDYTIQGRTVLLNTCTDLTTPNFQNVIS
jgi:hypothetical protein